MQMIYIIKGHDNTVQVWNETLGQYIMFRSITETALLLFTKIFIPRLHMESRRARNYYDGMVTVNVKSLNKACILLGLLEKAAPFVINQSK